MGERVGGWVGMGESGDAPSPAGALPCDGEGSTCWERSPPFKTLVRCMDLDGLQVRKLYRMQLVSTTQTKSEVTSR